MEPEKRKRGRPRIHKRPTREWLQGQLDLGQTHKDIAQKFGCTRSTLSAWIREAGLREPEPDPDRPRAPYKVGRGAGTRFYGVTHNWLCRQYVELDKSAKQISDELGTSHVTVIRWLKECGIPARTREEMNARHSVHMSGEGNPAWIDGGSQGYQKRKLEGSGLDKFCEWCGSDEEIQVHHVDHDRANHDLENLMWLCRHCNMIEAHLWALGRRVKVEMTDNQLTVTFMEVKRNG